MPDDWEWFWAGESGRDSLLRREIEGLSGEAASARSQAARLSSQLASVQGSLTQRVDALAAAFDAYVELGDVRVELARFPELAAVRRDAAAVLQALDRGERPAPVDDLGQDYWLAYAVNALVVPPSAGGSPRAELERARALSNDADLFAVCAAGALGRGEEFADLVPTVLICDGTLNPTQVLIWQGVLTGIYGPVLGAVLDVWRLGDPVADAWADWAVAGSPGRRPLDGLRWLDRLVTGDPLPRSAPADPAAASNGRAPVAADELVLDGEPAGGAPPLSVDPVRQIRGALRGVVTGLVDAGIGEEAGLLERARRLRVAIENPTAAGAGDETALADADVVAQVRSALAATPRESPRHQRLLAWSEPGIRTAVATLEQRVLESATPVVEKVRTNGGIVDVAPTGADPGRIARAETMLLERHTRPRRELMVPAIATGVLVLGTVVGLALGVTALTVLALIGAVIAIVVTLAAVATKRRAEADLAVERQELARSVDEGRVRARALDQVQRDETAEAARLRRHTVDALDRRLPA